jgi:hypothetical protein
MNSSTQVHPLQAAVGKATCVTASANMLFDLVKQKVQQLSAGALQADFRHQRVNLPNIYEFPNGLTNKVEVTVESRCCRTLEIEATLPDVDSDSGAKCMVAIFQTNRHQLPTKLEDYMFVPTFGRHGVTWQSSDGTSYSPQQLAGFALQRFLECLAECRR